MPPVSANSLVKVVIAKDELSASIVIRKPATGEFVPSLEQIQEELKAAGVVEGIQEQLIQDGLAAENWNVPFKVAEGIPGGKGENARLIYHFDTSAVHSPHEDGHGHIDYKDLSTIQNTSEGSVLVTREPARIGREGKTVTGKMLAGIMGKDVQLIGGLHTQVSPDGTTLTATASGVIQIVDGKVSVNDLFAVRGDVDHTIGNIDCRGSVKVGGDIKAGYRIKADGDLEVAGTVEDAVLEIGGRVLIKGGFIGTEGHLICGGDATVKFVEGQKIECQGTLTVGGELIGCHVYAKEAVRVMGRRGKIIGGEVFAGREVRASIIGSDTGAATRVTVGYDNELMPRHAHLVRELARLREDNKRINEALIGLYKLELSGKLPPDKKPAMEQLKSLKKELPVQMSALEEELHAVDESLKLLHDARVIVDEKVLSGARIAVGHVYREIMTDLPRCAFLLEGHQVVWTSDASMMESAPVKSA